MGRHPVGASERAKILGTGLTKVNAAVLGSIQLSITLAKGAFEERGEAGDAKVEMARARAMKRLTSISILRNERREDDGNKQEERSAADT